MSSPKLQFQVIDLSYNWQKGSTDNNKVHINSLLSPRYVYCSNSSTLQITSSFYLYNSLLNWQNVNTTLISWNSKLNEDTLIWSWLFCLSWSPRLRYFGFCRDLTESSQCYYKDKTHDYRKHLTLIVVWLEVEPVWVVQLSFVHEPEKSKVHCSQVSQNVSYSTVFWVCRHWLRKHM